MTCLRAAIGKSLAALRHEFPVVAARVQRQLEHTVCICIAHLAVGDNGGNGGVVCPASTDDELAQTSRTIQRSACILWSEALVDMVVAIPDQIRAVVIKRLPERLGVLRRTTAGTIKWYMPEGEGTEIGM